MPHSRPIQKDALYIYHYAGFTAICYAVQLLLG